MHSLGDGGNAALRGVGYFNLDFEPIAADGQLYAARDGGLSITRPQQCSRSQRFWVDAGLYPGYQKVAQEENRKKFEAGWGVKLPSKKGLDNHEMIRAIHDGKLRCMYIKGEDTITSDANSNDVGSAFEKLEFMVMQDVNFSETCKYADVILPASPSLEKEGTFTNTERRIQRLYRALDPLGESKPDWEIIQLIANRLGAGWQYQHPSQIMQEGCFAGADVRRRELRAFGRVQQPSVAR